MSSAVSGASTPSPIVADLDAKVAAKPKKHKFSFGDLLDVINPLQHIPVISTIYRAITHDKIRPEAQIAGDGLFGGVLGLALSAADQAVKAKTGKTVEGHLASLVTGKHKPQPRVDVGPIKVAGATPSEAQKPKTIPAPPGGMPNLSPAALDLLMKSVNESKADTLRTLATEGRSAAPVSAATRDDAYRRALDTAEAAMIQWRERSAPANQPERKAAFSTP